MLTCLLIILSKICGNNGVKIGSTSFTSNRSVKSPISFGSNGLTGKSFTTRGHKLAPTEVVDGACLEGQWMYLSPSAFDHRTTPAWTNEVCVYHWKTPPTGSVSFASPMQCRTDGWKHTPATITPTQGNNTLTFRFVLDDQKHTVITKTGVVGGNNCSFVDMNDGGLYLKATAHFFFVPPHEWIGLVSAWLVRAATIAFADGTRHLTPGYPTHYNGQWMRDGFYGISMLWDLASEQQQTDFRASAEWMFKHPRADGIMPQQCPPTGEKFHIHT